MKKIVALTVMMAACVSQAALIAYDGFDTSATGDAANGIYKSGAGFADAANSAVAGGTMVGFDASGLWTASSGNMQPLDGKGAQIPSWTAGESAARAMSVSMAGKTVAYGSAVVSVDLNYTSSYTPQAYVGFSDESFGSRHGAGVGLKWNGSGYDVAVRYRANGAWAFNSVAGTSYGTDTGDIFLVWKMDEVNDTLSVWVNPLDENAAPAAVFTDFEGAVSTITHLNALTSRVNQTSPTGGFRFDEVKLGDEMMDVIPEPASINLLGLACAAILIVRKTVLKR